MAKPKKHPDEEIMRGTPQHGDKAPDDDPVLIEDQNDPGDADPPEPRETAEQKEIRELKEQVAELSRKIPPAQPKIPSSTLAEEGEDDLADIENLLFSDPKKALALYGEKIQKRISNELRAEYQREDGTRRFWDGFFSKHKDLKDDEDIVKMILNQNLAELANVPVAQAQEKLADLTRDRLLRMSGGSRGKKVRVEGSDPPRGRREAPQNEDIPTLGDVIRMRRQKRATAA